MIKLRISNPLFIAFLFSISAAPVIWYLFISKILPFNINLVNTFVNNVQFISQYHDFDHDNYSEYFYVITDKNNVIGIRLPDGRFLDEFPTNGEVIRYAFHDMDHDGIDEIYAFEKLNDSLFLSIISVKNRDWILKNQFITSRENKSFYPVWDVDYGLQISFKDLNNDSFDDMVFSISTGYALFPRGLFIFDGHKKTITSSFYSTIRFLNLIISDVQNDGNYEIIALGQASGNIHFPVEYSDNKAWLFIFNTDLELIKKPMALADYPGALEQFLVLEDQNEIYFSSHTYNKNKTNVSIYKIGLNLEPEKVLSLPIVKRLAISIKKDSWYKIILQNGFENEFLFFENSLESPTSIKLSYSLNLTDNLIYYDYKENPLLIGFNNNDLYLLDDNLKIKGKFKNAYFPSDHISLYYNGSPFPSGFGYPIKEGFITYTFNKNRMYEYKILFFLLLLIMVYGITILILRIAQNHIIAGNIFELLANHPHVGLGIISKSGKFLFQNHAFEEYQSLLETVSRNNQKEICSESPYFFFENNHFDSHPLKTKNKIHMIELNINNNKIFLTGIINKSNHFPDIDKILILTQMNQSSSNQKQEWINTLQQLAHKMKTPISSIVLNLKSLEQKLLNNCIDNSGELSNSLKIIQNELKYIKNSAESFTRLSSVNHVKSEWFDIDQLIDKCKFKFRSHEQLGHQLNISKDERLKHIYGDPDLLFEALQLCIENSFQSQDSPVIVNLSFKKVNLIADSDREYTEIEISDNGPGIPSEILKKVWDPFFTTKTGGNGLGLFFLKKIIEEHGGTVDIYTRSKIGTTVQILLPIPQLMVDMKEFQTQNGGEIS